MNDPREIYLEPACCASQPEGRMWCEHDAPADCPEGTSWTRYVLASDYDALAARLAEAERDAKRYRWLRNESNSSQGETSVTHGYVWVEDLDAFVDAAMGEKP